MANLLFKSNLVSLRIYNQNNLEITFKIMEKYLEIYVKNLEKLWKSHGIFSVRKGGNPVMIK